MTLQKLCAAGQIVDVCFVLLLLFCLPEYLFFVVFFSSQSELRNFFRLMHYCFTDILSQLPGLHMVPFSSSLPSRDRRLLTASENKTFVEVDLHSFTTKSSSNNNSERKRTYNHNEIILMTIMIILIQKEQMLKRSLCTTE